MSAPLPPLTAPFVEALEAETIPKRRRILGWSLIRQQVSLLIAPPGIGKSTLGIAQAIAICTGNRLTGQEVVEQGNVWIYNNEDGRDELERRVAALLQFHELSPDDIAGRLALSSGSERALLVARSDKRGGVLRLPDVDACIELIKRQNIIALIVDPFTETHEVQENSNEQIKQVAQFYRDIAWRGDCAVLLVHHTAKPPQGSSEGHAGNMHSARGASTLAGVARVVQTIFSMSSKDAAQLGVPETEKHLYVRLDDAKANLSLVTSHALWFKRVGITIGNGDEVGILQPVNLRKPSPDDTEITLLYRAIMDALVERIREDRISVNAAAKQLAWSDDPQFYKYRETDSRNNKRARRIFREAITDTCRAGISVETEGCVRTFVVVEGSKPMRLQRVQTVQPSEALPGEDCDAESE